MTHQFSQVPKAEIQRSSFDRSHGVKTTFDAGLLIPIFVDEALPGDSFNVSLTAFARMATPIFPIMDNLRMETFFFAVPYRLVWNQWQKFMGERESPGDDIDFTVPQISLSSAVLQPNSIYDYMGLPINETGFAFNTLHLRAYNLIWNEWFRDQNLQDPVEVTKTDTGDGTGDFSLLRRGKRHDYFTSCLPFPQKGEDVTIGIGVRAPVEGIGIFGNGTSPGNFGSVRETEGTANESWTAWARDGSTSSSTLGYTTMYVEEDPDNPGFPAVYANLANASSITINELREAFQIQRLLERDSRGGSRYIEIIKSHFGVSSPDSRLQRPEYLGGGSSPINITPVASTVPTDLASTTPQGNLAAVGTASLSGHGFNKSFTEHCLLLGMVCVRADLTYQQNLNRMWSRQTRYDFYWPALAHLGEQAVLSKEIFVDGTAGDETIFGYQERYAEYRYKPSIITGEFRSKNPQSLDAWHLSQDFGSTRPLLNASFIEENPPIDRVVAVPSEPDFILDGFFNMRCARPMPLYGVPGLIDHF